MGRLIDRSLPRSLSDVSLSDTETDSGVASSRSSVVGVVETLWLVSPGVTDLSLGVSDIILRRSLLTDWREVSLAVSIDTLCPRPLSTASKDVGLDSECKISGDLIGDVLLSIDLRHSWMGMDDFMGRWLDIPLAAGGTVAGSPSVFSTLFFLAEDRRTLSTLGFSSSL